MASQSSDRKAVFTAAVFTEQAPSGDGGGRKAAEPTITFSAPRETSSFARFTSRMPPPTRTFPRRSSFFTIPEFTVMPGLLVFPRAASRSMERQSEVR